MNDRPMLEKGINSETFKSFYYLKEELISFCKKNGLQASGGKIELTNKIAHFLDTGEKTCINHIKTKNEMPEEILRTTAIERNFVCSEKHRSFYKKEIGESFSFNVIFQKWLKNNAGKTYEDSITAYYKILEEKKKNKTVIDSQFEYNTYIRDFFQDNKGKSLEQAIKCWKYKKSIKGNNKYEKSDLKIL